MTPIGYLLDTRSLLWALGEPDALSNRARAAIGDTGSIVQVSTASLWECAIKASIGKLDLPEEFFDAVTMAGFEELQIRIPHLEIYVALPMHHRDSFDRMLVAQATAESLTLVSNDSKIAEYDVDVLT